MFGIVAVLALTSCEGAATGTPVTSLTYSAFKIDATEGSTINDITPTIVPQDATVEYAVSPMLPAGLEFNPKSGTISGTPTDAYVAAAVYTVTATGTGSYKGTVSTDITITVGTLSTTIEVNIVAKANPAEDKRYHYVAFTVKADGTSSMGRYKFALSPKTNPAPTAQEMNDGDGVYRIVKPTEKKVLLSYTLGSGISELMTDANYLGKMIKHGDQIGGTAADVDGYLLSPGTEFTLYARKDGGSSVEKLSDFTTDTFDTSSTFTGEDKLLDTSVFGGEYMIDLDDAVFVFPISFTIPSSGHAIYEASAVGFAAQMLVRFKGGSFAATSEALNSLVVALVPSQSIEGGNPNVSMSNTNIVTWYLLMPMNSVKVGKEFRLRSQGTGINLGGITPTLDQ